jgi:hypothetical protein
MPDSTSTTGERTVIVHRHGVLTYVSLALNALILLLILVGVVAHHPRGPEDKGGGDGFARHHEGPGRDGPDWAHFHHGDFSGMGPGGFHGSFGGRDGRGEDCPMGGPGGEARDFGPGDDRGGWGGEPHGFGMGQPRGWGGGPPGDFGGPGMGGHPGMGGFDGGGDGFIGKTPPSAEEMTDRFMLMLAPKLSLTDAESAQVRPIIQNGIEQLQKDMEAQKQAHQKMIEDAKAKIRAVLTPDQQKQFDELTAHMSPPPVPPAK